MSFQKAWDEWQKKKAMGSTKFTKTKGDKTVKGLLDAYFGKRKVDERYEKKNRCKHKPVKDSNSWKTDR